MVSNSIKKQLFPCKIGNEKMNINAVNSVEEIVKDDSLKETENELANATNKLDLSPLPGHLKYVFLDNKKNLPVIISNSLKEEKSKN